MKLRQKKKTIRNVVVKSRQGHGLKFILESIFPFHTQTIINMFLNGIPRNSRPQILNSTPMLIPCSVHSPLEDLFQSSFQYSWFRTKCFSRIW